MPKIKFLLSFSDWTKSVREFTPSSLAIDIYLKKKKNEMFYYLSILLEAGRGEILTREVTEDIRSYG